MPNASFASSIPVAAALDPQYRLPPFQQHFLTPSIVISIALLIAALIVVIFLSRRSRIKGRQDARREALKGIEKVILKRGGNPDDVDRMISIFNAHPKFDPASMLMLKDRFHDELRPILEVTFDFDFGEKMEKIFFPPYKDTRFARQADSQPKSCAPAPDGKTPLFAVRTEEALRQLMDSTLKPGSVTRLVFDGLDETCECLVMGHDSKAINVTLPAHRDRFIAALQPGMSIEGTLENGPSLIGFNSSVIQAIAGSMPYCRIAPWKSAWEIRKRASIRLPAVLDVDFQHISTATADSINMSNLEKEIGDLRPGRLIDISHGGCCIETPSEVKFAAGDMIRFSKIIAPGDPSATFLGSIVNIDEINPEQSEGSRQRLHIQFLIIDDISQRILVRALRQLQSAKDRDEWMQAQQLLQQIRRNNITNIGSPAPGGGTPRRESATGVSPARSSTRIARKPPTRSVPKSALRDSSKHPGDDTELYPSQR